MFNAILIEKQADIAQQITVKTLGLEQLPEGDVLVEVDYSTINYKDALAITGRSPVVRKFPMVPGIDLAGTVIESQHEYWNKGDTVILNGWGVGEGHWGGLSQFARLKGDWLIECPQAFNSRDAMAIGTAGYTASLCVEALMNNGIKPGVGEILVTGASGGVGSIAIMLLSAAGYDVAASTGKLQEESYLASLGAKTIVDRSTLSEKGKPLQKERWAGVIDAVGGFTLANACAQVRYGGVVAACGLAQSMDFPASVAPFILRGITLSGVDSVMASVEHRKAAWSRLAKDIDKILLASVVTEVSLQETIGIAGDVLDGKIRGRLIVDVNR